MDAEYPVVTATPAPESAPEIENTVEVEDSHEDDSIDVTTEGETETEVESEATEEDAEDPTKPSKAQQRIEALARKNKELKETARRAEIEKSNLESQIEYLNRQQELYLRSKTDMQSGEVTVEDLKAELKAEMEESRRLDEIRQKEERLVVAQTQVELGKATSSLPILTKSDAAAQIFSHIWASQGTVSLADGTVLPTTPVNEAVELFKELIPQLMREYSEDLRLDQTAKEGLLKGTKSPRETTAPSQQKITRESIAKMSTDEYEKNRSTIEKMLALGKL